MRDDERELGRQNVGNLMIFYFKKDYFWFLFDGLISIKEN